MKGLELAEKFYQEYGCKMISENFSDVEKYLAFGLAGSGSECFGYDDEISRDHDFEPGFCIFLPDESVIDTRTEFQLERAYSKLPKEFMGFERSKLSPVGGNRHGVIRISDFFEQKTGDKKGEIPAEGWFYISEQFLLEATNGKIFCDNYGEVTAIREKLSYLPEDVRLKKLAGNLLVMAQSGQYNFPRLIKRGEKAAAQLAVTEFVNASLKVIFLLNKKYIPYYKWAFRALEDLEKLSFLYDELEWLISNSNEPENVIKKQEKIERIASCVRDELVLQGLTKSMSDDLEKQAYSANNAIKDSQIRNLNILYAV
ncbi:MAG: DUF4037 domain-containing protein [Clostridia bacterium]|nr:DUF4037 domain-containing protein [Clostridia bacterium]